MKDVIAGRGPGTSDEGSGLLAGGTPPPVLLAALGAAVVIAVTLVAFLVGGGGGSDRTPLPAGAAGVDDPGRGGTPTPDARVLLTVSIEGGGSGKVLIEPRAISCAESCEHQFVVGSRVTLSGHAVPGSRFEGWDDACTGDSARCTFVMDRERSVTATFEGTPSASAQCSDGRDNDGDGLVDDADPGCRADATEAPDNRPPTPVGDCHDGRDNDGDGLVDSAQDPGCAADGTEADPGAPPPPTTTTPPPVAPPPPPPPTTTTTPTTAAPPATPGVSECRDGRDNDGDGLTDRPADPGCDADGTEGGG
jgi:hypothetical protein